MFNKILIVNRGEIAVRIIRACREMGIKTVAIYSEADRDSLHTMLADEAIRIGPAASSQSYLNMGRILTAMVAMKVDVIHPGLGFLSENARFVELCEKCSIIFIGPLADIINKMGNKSEARKTMMEAGMPVVPGDKEPVCTVGEAKVTVQEVGYPVMIKASSGGDGKGVRTSHNDEDFEASLQNAQMESVKGFSDDTMYIEKYIKKPRYIEFQIMADKHGHMVHPGERDYSIQGYHQKVLEESPSAVISEELRQRMGETAIRAVKAVGYESVGTVEFLLDKHKNFYFMETNTRIQVEHPATEMATGMDLIKEQIRMATGEPLSVGQEDVEIRGHVIECRINAENPSRNFMPCPGLITDVHVPGGNGVRVDSHIYDNYKVPANHDSILLRLIVYGKDRQDAIREMRSASGGLVIERIEINLDFQFEILSHEAHREGDMDTHSIPTYFPQCCKQFLDKIRPQQTRHRRLKMLRDTFKRTYTLIDTKYKTPAKKEPNIPEGLWRKCNRCGQPVHVEDVKDNYHVCPKRKGYLRVHVYRRIETVVDEGIFEEWNKQIEFSNPLNSPGYEIKVKAAREKTKLDEATATGKGLIHGQLAAIGAYDARFLMSSMGHAVGEKITSMVERATKEKLPVIISARSGGARMQEGTVSLMQMTKISAALKRHHNAGQLFISMLTDPTTGGVTASSAMLGDTTLTEPNALIGFAGLRAIQQTIGQKLLEGFQRSEFLLEHGFVDKIVERHEPKDTLARILAIHTGPRDSAEKISRESAEKIRASVDNPNKKPKVSGKTTWDMVQPSGKADRPVATDYINHIFDNFMESHGDRYLSDDGATVGGIATFRGMPVMVIGQQKGKNTKRNIRRNFGMPSPKGYKKVLRLMKQADTFGRPVTCFVDTPGAFCDLEAEERGQGEATVRDLFEMADLQVPVLSVVVGEGGNGGVLAMAVANEVWMVENSIYLILSPEGFVSILWKDSKKTDQTAQVMWVTARDLLSMHLIERTTLEEEPVSVDNAGRVVSYMEQAIKVLLVDYGSMSGEELVEQRYQRFWGIQGVRDSGVQRNSLEYRRLS